MKKYLVIGNPINHSLSPKLQNWWLKENNINATYDKIKLEDHEIKNFIQTIKEQKIAGCNVTVPFKKTVIPFLDKLSPEAEHTQSVNTIIFDNGYLVGHNTDIAGFDSAIRKLNFSVNGKKVLILGAGGVVPSIRGKKSNKIYEFVGPICESTDKFTSIKNFQELKEKDFIAICDVGAYGISLSSNYNLRPKPIEILINGSKIRVVKKRQKHHEII